MDHQGLKFNRNADSNDVFKESTTYENVDILLQKVIHVEESPSQFIINKFCEWLCY